ncbi:MAG: 6-bladed beta-propeller [Prolixibacteraceae bacterium]|nr:6-bladed beta-propeller [Prolixibacteraceae bacterium]
MKHQITTLAIILFVTAGFVRCKQSDTNQLITVDVTKSYPEKELILQDFMDVEYIPLETSDDFVTNGVVMALGNKFIVVKNWSNDGNIYVFDRKTGKALRKINRMGKGPEEYSHLTDIVLDEQNNELFVNCLISKKILVYDLFGNFKRSFNHAEDTRYVNVFNYDNDNLICYNELTLYKDGENRGSESFHMILSKQDGSITRKITIPFDVIRTPFIVGEGGRTVSTFVSPIIPYQNTWLLVETSSDTIYNYIPKENKLIPFLAKNPTADPEIFLTMGALTDRYYFFIIMKKEFDFTNGRGFPISDLMYDTQENVVYERTVVNGDFVKRKSVDITSHPVNGDEIAAFQNLEAYQLGEAYKNNELKGNLKEVAAKLNEESNPVIMLMKYKR